MTRLLEQTFDQLRQQSPEVQDSVAQLVRDTMADEVQWQVTFGTEASESWLAEQAKNGRAAIKAGKPTDFDPQFTVDEIQSASRLLEAVSGFARDRTRSGPAALSGVE